VDDLNPTGYAQVIDEVVNGAAVREYALGLQRIDESQPINGTWTPSFYGYDGGGTVRQLTNLSGNVTNMYEYDAFGYLLTSTGTTPNNYLYRGEQYDANLGLYYLRARYYNPATGRFLGRDPEDGIPTDPKTLHKYIYAGGDPVNAVDPTGRNIEEYPTFTLIVGGSAVGAIEGVVGTAASNALIAAGLQDLVGAIEVALETGEVLPAIRLYISGIKVVDVAVGVSKILFCEAGAVLLGRLVDGVWEPNAKHLEDQEIKQGLDLAGKALKAACLGAFKR
jgi:RHS repeat-associated protein